MAPLKIILMTLLYLGAVTAIPDDVLCCPPGVGSFLANTTVCWDEKTNRTSPLSLQCDEYESISDNMINMTINDAGRVYYNVRKGLNLEISYGTYCLATEWATPEGGWAEPSTVVVSCYEEPSPRSLVLSYCMIVSSIFLYVTAVVYVAVAELRDLQGKSIINFCASLATGLTILGFMNLTSYSDMNLCAVRGFLVYFFILASFFWMNAIAVQIVLSMSRPLVNNYSWKQFSWYALYAWGCPVVLTVITAIVNFHPGYHAKPGIGLNTCWFFDQKQQWYYMYSVMSILIVANICIFLYTSISMWRLTFASNHIKAFKYKFLMSLRLFIIMGLPWVFEMIGSLAQKSIIWFILDIANALQGPLMFLVLVVLRRRALAALLRRGALGCAARVAERHLAARGDGEAGAAHTAGVSLDERGAA